MLRVRRWARTWRLWKVCADLGLRDVDGFARRSLWYLGRRLLWCSYLGRVLVVRSHSARWTALTRSGYGKHSRDYRGAHSRHGHMVLLTRTRSTAQRRRASHLYIDCDPAMQQQSNGARDRGLDPAVLESPLHLQITTQVPCAQPPLRPLIYPMAAVKNAGPPPSVAMQGP